MQKKLIIITSLITCAILMGACAPSAVQEAQISVVDGLGKEITLEAPATSIVTLAPPNTEILFAIGAGEQVVGRDSFSDYPEEALELPDVGGGYAEYDLETIVSLEPDLVIAGGINTPELVQSLEDLELTVYYLANPSDLQGTFTAIQTLGTLSGHEDKADALISDLKTRVSAVDDALADVETRPTVFYELDASDPSAPYTAGPGSFYSAMIERAGGENIGDALEMEWAQISLENLLVADPDFILLGDSLWGETPETVAARAGWGALRAVQEGRVVPFDDNLIARIGPRQVDGLEALAEILHPEAFE